MTSHDFNQVFKAEVIDRLATVGFCPRGKNGKTVDLVEGITMVSLLRRSGFRVIPGWAEWMLCFRHAFLREVTELKVVPAVSGIWVSDYPFKFAPSRLIDGSQELRYHAQLNPDFDHCFYEVLTTEKVQCRLRALAEFIAERFVPWARTITPAAAREQLRQLGAGRWDAGIWIEDYDRYLAQK